MKHDIRDLLTLICLLLHIAAASVCVYLLYPAIQRVTGSLAPLAVAIAFPAIHGILATAYLRALNRVLPFTPGVYDLDHYQFAMWKHHAVVGSLPRTILAVTPAFLRAAFYKLLGARIGRNAAVGGTIIDPLITVVEDGAVIGEGSIVTAHTVAGSTFVIQPVIIRRGATVGVNVVLMPGADVGEHAVVAPGAVVKMGTRIPAYDFWGGVPAKKIKSMDSAAEHGSLPVESVPAMRPLEAGERMLVSAGIEEREAGWN